MKKEKKSFLTGIEPVTLRLTAARSNQLSYKNYNYYNNNLSLSSLFKIFFTCNDSRDRKIISE
jgi:hypothetical protein